MRRQHLSAGPEVDVRPHSLTLYRPILMFAMQHKQQLRYNHVAENGGD